MKMEISISNLKKIILTLVVSYVGFEKKFFKTGLNTGLK